jgi:hypothetical protein
MIKDPFQAGLAVLSISLLFGCAGPRMVPPAEIAQGSKVLDVQNRKNASGAFVNEAFDLGSSKVSKVDRNASKNSSFSVGGYGSSKTKAGYSYEYAGAQGPWTGACASLMSEKGFSVGGSSFARTKTNVTCECTSGAAKATLDLKSGDDKPLEGTLTGGGGSYKVTPVTTMDKKYFGAGPAGYRIDADDGPRGAVEVLHPGRVWLTEKLPEPERDPATCVMVGLMLYKEPSDH